MTRAAKIRKLFNSGRPRTYDEIMTVMAAYLRAGLTLEKLQSAVVAEGLEKSDCGAALVVREHSTDPVLHRVPVSLNSMDAAIAKLMNIPKPLPLGIVFYVFDREDLRPGHQVKLWITPFLTGPDAVDDLKTVLEQLKEGKIANYSA